MVQDFLSAEPLRELLRSLCTDQLLFANAKHVVWNTLLSTLLEKASGASLLDLCRIVFYRLRRGGQGFVMRMGMR